MTPADHDPLTDAALLRGLTERRLSRRDLLRYTSAGAGAAGLSAFLSACGVSSTKTKAKPAATNFWTGKKQAGVLSFANWPLYIDKVVSGGKTTYPSLDLFTKQTGIKVTYREVIQDDPSFFGKIQPALAAGQGIGYDLMVITNGLYLSKLIDLNYLIPLDHSKLPNFFKNAGPKFQNPSYDPGNKFTVPWQSGITGIGYNPKLTKREINSFDDLFDPAFKGKVGMFADNQDLPNLALLGVGVNPETSTPTDWKKAADKLHEQRSAGLVRKYYEQDYIDPLSKGDIWLSMAWSGDIFQANASSNAGLKFVVPQQGGLLWTDNMCIPAHATHPVDAITYMNYVYDPKNAALLTEYINYITPVPAAQPVIVADAAAATNKDDKATLEYVATSPLVFPKPSDLARTKHYRVLSATEEKQWNQLFEPIYQA